MVGNGAIVLHRSVVGTGAIVAANAVVLYDVDVPPGALAVGAPATIKPGRARTEEITNERRQVRAPAATGSAASCGGSTEHAGPRRHRAGQRGRAGERRAVGARRGGHRGAPADGDSDPTQDHFVELWTSLGDDVDAVTRAADAFPKRWRWRTVELDAAVAESWRAHAVPSWVDADLVIVPAWQDVPTPPAVLRVDIDPGAAFGLGDHPDDDPVAAAAARGAVVRAPACSTSGAAAACSASSPPGSARRTSRRSTSRWPRSRRRRPTPGATASPASSRPAPRHWRRSTSGSTSCWPTCWPPSSSTSPPTCGA